jgi:transcriptional regulator with XRE-family HTH domain
MDELARSVVKKRAGKGIRETAKLIGISPATLSRVEKGNVTDLETFRKICNWLEVDPGTFLRCSPARSATPEIRVHFKKDKELKPETAKALAEMIMKAHEAMRLEEEV